MILYNSANGLFSQLVEPKPRRPRCLSTPSAVGKKTGERSHVSHTPVQTPSSRPVSHTEPRVLPNSRY